MDLERHGLKLGAKPALLVVDVINGFTDHDSPLGTDCPDVISANLKLLTAFRKKERPIFYTTVVYSSPDQARVFRDKLPALDMLTPESKWIEIDSRLNRLPNEIIIEKQWASAFFRTNLDGYLRSFGVDSLVVTGLTTSGCVRATVVDALQYNYKVVVPRDAVGDRNPSAHQANIFDMHKKYADVLSLEETLTLL